VFHSQKLPFSKNFSGTRIVPLSQGVPQTAWDTQSLEPIEVTVFSTSKLVTFEKNFFDCVLYVSS
jgi:hypothetical protein